MASIRWDHCLETGWEVLDAQHRTLVDTLNRLGCLVAKGGRQREELEGVLIFLRNFTLEHFQTEQELMARHRYPDEIEHRRLHSDLAAQIEAILDAFHRGETALTPVTLEVLDAWLTRHIQEEDVRLADFLNGAEPRPRGLK
jgi:hemerythrin-like metal-binding protein